MICAAADADLHLFLRNHLIECDNLMKCYRCPTPRVGPAAEKYFLNVKVLHHASVVAAVNAHFAIAAAECTTKCDTCHSVGTSLIQISLVNLPELMLLSLQWLQNARRHSQCTIDFRMHAQRAAPTLEACGVVMYELISAVVHLPAAKRRGGNDYTGHYVTIVRIPKQFDDRCGGCTWRRLLDDQSSAAAAFTEFEASQYLNIHSTVLLMYSRCHTVGVATAAVHNRNLLPASVVTVE